MDGRRIVDDFEESLLTERRGVLAVNEALFYILFTNIVSLREILDSYLD